MRFLIILFISLTAGAAGISVAPTDESIVTSDVTTNNASSTKHGFLLKLENTGSKYLRDDGTWQSIAGGGDMVLATSQTVTGAKSFNQNTLLLNGTTGTTWLNGPASGASTTITLPAWTGTVVTAATSQTITDKTLTTPSIAGATLSGTVSGSYNLYGTVGGTLLNMTGGNFTSITASGTNLYGTTGFGAGSKINGYFDGDMSVSGVWTSTATDAFKLVTPIVSQATVGNYMTFPTNVAATPSAGFGNLYYSGSTFRFKNSGGTIYRFTLNEGTNAFSGSNEFSAGVSFTGAVSMTGGGFLGGNWAGSISATTTTSASMTGIIQVNPTVSGVITVNDNLKIAATKGINFSAMTTSSTSTATQVCDDYDFSPGVSMTLNASTTSGTPTYAVNWMAYEKKCRSVHIDVYLDWSAWSSGAGNIRFVLPYTAANLNTNYRSSCRIGLANNLSQTASTTLAMVINPGIYANLVQIPVSGTTSNVAYDPSGTIQFSCDYIAL